MNWVWASFGMRLAYLLGYERGRRAMRRDLANAKNARRDTTTLEDAVRDEWQRFVKSQEPAPPPASSLKRIIACIDDQEPPATTDR